MVLKTLKTWCTKFGFRADRIVTLVYYVLFLGIFALLLWRCPYGFGQFDETFYLLVPFRVIHGDHLILHEWNLCQFSFFGLIPTVWLYEQFIGTTEGILLNFRYFYTVCWAAASLFLYLRTRKLNRYGAMFVSLFILPYTPFGIMAFSYNALSILYLLNAAVFLLCAQRCQKLQFAVSGVFFSLAVLCYPYLAVIYLLYSLLAGITKIRGCKPVIPLNGADIFTVWKWFTLGVVMTAALFLVTVLWNVSPERLIAAFMEELKDPNHDNTAFALNTVMYFRNISQSNVYFFPMLITVLVMTVLSLYRRKAIWLAVVCVAVTLYLRRFLVEWVYINYLMLPLTFAGLYVLIVSRNSLIRWIGILWLIPGVIYTFVIQQLSTQDLYAICSAATVPSAASILLLWIYCGELKTEYQGKEGARQYGWLIGKLAVLVLMAFQLRYAVPVRYQSVYWEPGLMKYEEQARVEEGPEKGLIATVENVEKYNKIYPDIQGVDHEKLLVLSDQFWIYLVNRNDLASYSGWLGTLDHSTLDLLETYYEYCPEKKPSLIFLENVNEKYLDYFVSLSYTFEKTENGHFLIRPPETV